MICVPGDDVAPLQDGLMRGHGTYAHSNQLVSCGSGRIERVNKLASVRPVRGRYTGSVGDLVVGEIVEVAHRSWKVDVGSTRKATLAITSVTLPDDAQRVRTHEDTLAMRELFKEGDVVVCEVQAVNADGQLHLHMKSNRYGVLENGCVVRVNQHLVRRLKHHFVELPDINVELCVGHNGRVWVQRAIPSQWINEEAQDGGGGAGEADALLSAEAWRRVRKRHSALPLEDNEREACCRARNAVAVLGSGGCVVDGASILKIYRASLGDAPSKLLTRDVSAKLVADFLGDRAPDMDEEGDAMQLN